MDLSIFQRKEIITLSENATYDFQELFYRK